MRYTERVKRGLEGLEAVSSGVCGGCEECREATPDFVPVEAYDEDCNSYWTFRADDDLTHYGSEDAALVVAREAFQEAVSACEVPDEGHFSWGSCGVCGSSLGGDRYVWHYWHGGKLWHADDMCGDCVTYLANGDLPEGAE